MKTRLVDADKLVDSLRASMNHGRETFPVDLIVEAIDEQPTIKYIEQISRDDIEDICFKLTCYYIATTELYDRSLTDERRVEDNTEAFTYSDPRIRRLSNKNAILTYKMIQTIAEYKFGISRLVFNRSYKEQLKRCGNLSAQGWIDKYNFLCENGEMDFIEECLEDARSM